MLYGLKFYRTKFIIRVYVVYTRYFNDEVNNTIDTVQKGCSIG